MNQNLFSKVQFQSLSPDGIIERILLNCSARELSRQRCNRKCDLQDREKKVMSGE